MLARTRASGAPERFGPLAIRENAHERVGERMRVAWWNAKPGTLVVHDVGEAADLARDDRRAAHHRFRRREAERLRPARWHRVHPRAVEHGVERRAVEMSVQARGVV